MADVRTAVCNLLWAGSCLPAWNRFRRALRDPGVVQFARLRSYLERNSETAFGRRHRFDSIGSYEAYASRVPLSDYEDLAPWMERIGRGEDRVLTHEKVTRFVPTSGTRGAQKLIPFTTGLQDEFNAAIDPWWVDVCRLRPGSVMGPAYWSLTPVIRRPGGEKFVVPVGFHDDTAYLGGWKERLVDMAMAAPAWLKNAPSLESFRYAVLLALLRRPDLRMVSVWHPSFFLLLLDALPEHWASLVKDVDQGTHSHVEAFKEAAVPVRPDPSRARMLRGVSPSDPSQIWPELKVISCWAEGAASSGWEELRRRFPAVLVQGKGLLATEAVVSLPFGRFKPLAVCSHFFEFVDDKGRIFTADALRKGGEYEVVVTTAGGLWRYRLGDRIAVDGFCGETPSIRFLGRKGSVSDWFGEKLSDAFVADAIRGAWPSGENTPPFVMVAPERDGTGIGYTIYVEGRIPAGFEQALEVRLCENPHYAYCRDLGQLLPLKGCAIRSKGYESYVRRHLGKGFRLGDIKPAAISSWTDWAEYFEAADRSDG